MTISTIHKIQGMTCQYTIYHMPLNHSFMDLDDHLFNVATSRATKGTLIITYQHLELISGKSKEVSTFIKGCKNVSQEFKIMFNL